MNNITDDKVKDVIDIIKNMDLKNKLRLGLCVSSTSYTNLKYNKAHIHSVFDKRLKEIDKNNKSFEDIKHTDENGVEFWYARELMPILQYSNWQNFEKIVNKAKISCENSNINVLDHFTDISKMVQIGSGAERKQQDYELTRYACYLIAQNGDSRKKVIALAQTYFAVQTRKQENA